MKSIKILKMFVVMVMVTVACMSYQSTDYAYGAENLKVIAHGGGETDSFEASNSVEAVKKAIKNGFELIELDLSLTSDNEIVMVHDWIKTSFHYLGEKRANPVSLKEFKNFKNLASPEPLTLEGLISIFKENPNSRIVTDTKVETVNILTRIAKTYPEYINRFVPQIYYVSEYDAVKKLGYKDIILTLYLHRNYDVNEIIKFAKENNLYAVTMPTYDANNGICKTMSDAGVNVFVHPITTKEEAHKYFNMGAKKVYSATLLPKEFENPENTYYLQVTENGSDKKLVDETYEASVLLFDHVVGVNEHPMNIKNLKVAGLKAEEKARITFQDPQDVKLSELGAKILKLDIFGERETKLAGLNYSVLQTKKEFKIVQEKASYKLYSLKEHKDIESIALSEESKNILINSTIVKKGESIYYDRGTEKVFQKEKDRFPVRSGKGGRTLIPMTNIFMDLGAKSVKMNKYKAVEVIYGGDTYAVPVGGYSVKNGMSTTPVQTPTIEYEFKSMAPAEVIKVITKREYIEEQGIVIILPLNANIKKEIRNELLNVAPMLF